MRAFTGKKVLVIGLGLSGRAACAVLRKHGARVVALDHDDSEGLRQEAGRLRADGVEVHLGAAGPVDPAFDWVVVSPGVPSQGRWVQAMAQHGVPVIGELELGFAAAQCACIAITGTNGKTTTTELVEQLLSRAGLRTVAAGNIGRPLCAAAEPSRNLDFLTLEVSSFQLETIRSFHPAVAVLLNLTPDHLDRYAGMSDYIRAKARVFLNQLPSDWAIVQQDALAQLRALKLAVPARLLTFSAHDPHADLYREGSRLISRLPDCPGPLLDMSQGRLRGPHNAENLMAALAVGWALRLPLSTVAAALNSYCPAPHRCELVAEAGGVKFFNDSKATNVDAVRQALLTVPGEPNGAPNVWLIAGGKDKGFAFDELGPEVAARVKGAFLLGETREKIRAAWDSFTPCVLVESLLEAVTEAAQQAVSGDVVLLSPACSSFDQFQNYQHRGELFRQAAQRWAQRRLDREPESDLLKQNEKRI